MAQNPKDKNHDNNGQRDHTRRDALRLAGGASVLGASGLAQAQGATTSQPVREALETLTAAEADILEAFCARLIPTDANGPGAREARAAHYIDRALGGALASAREIYRSGLMALDAPCTQSKGSPFSALDAQGAGHRADRHREVGSLLLQSGAPAHASGHILRPLLWGQCRLCRLGPARLSRHQDGRCQSRTKR